MALKVGFIPIEGGRLLSRGARGSDPRGGARLRLRVDGGAPLGHQPLLALAADGAGRLRHSHLADDARHRHRRRRLPPPGAPGRGRGHAGRDVRWALRPRHRDRLQARRVRALRRRSREARRPVRGAARDHAGPVDAGAGPVQGHLLHAAGTARAQAGAAAAPSGVDRRLGGHHAATGGDPGRQLDPRSHRGSQASARRPEAVPGTADRGRPGGADRVAAHARRDHRGLGQAGPGAGRGAHHGRLPAGVRRRLAASRSSTPRSPPISTG